MLPSPHQPPHDGCSGTGGWCRVSWVGENWGLVSGFFGPLLTTFWFPIHSYLNKTFYGCLMPLPRTLSGSGPPPWVGGGFPCAGTVHGTFSVGTPTLVPAILQGSGRELLTETETGKTAPAPPHPWPRPRFIATRVTVPRTGLTQPARRGRLLAECRETRLFARPAPRCCSAGTAPGKAQSPAGYQLLRCQGASPAALLGAFERAGGWFK